MLRAALSLTIALVAGPQGQSRIATERAIQAAAIDSLFLHDTTRAVVVRDSTISGGSHHVDQDYRTALRWLGVLPRGLREDFERVRDKRRATDGLRTRVIVIPSRARRSMGLPRDPEDFWRAFYRRYPGTPGLIAVSRPGVSRDGQTALLLVEHGCGPRCGGTQYVLLERRGGRWHVVRVAQPRVA